MWFFKRKKKENTVVKTEPVVVEEVKVEEPKEDIVEVEKEPENVLEPVVKQVDETPALEKDDTEDLTTKTVAELKQLAKDKGLSGYSSLKKAELIKLLEE